MTVTSSHVTSYTTSFLSNYFFHSMTSLSLSIAQFLSLSIYITYSLSLSLSLSLLLPPPLSLLLPSPSSFPLPPSNRRGLLTRRQLTVGPEFGITLNATEALDGFHVIFGTVLEGFEVLEAIALVPTYSYKTKTGAWCVCCVCSVGVLCM